jgi:TatA/E family protein of Tat protein translocase
LFGLGGTELAIILLFGFLIFGPDKMPEIARTIGRVIRQFRTAQDQMNKVSKEEVYDPIKDLEPLVNPFASLLDDDKKPAAEKPKAADKPVDEDGADGDAGVNGEAAAGQAAKPDPSDLMAAATQDARRRQARVAPAAGGAAQADKAGQAAESFAERRARLEREHAAKQAAGDRLGGGIDEEA